MCSSPRDYRDEVAVIGDFALTPNNELILIWHEFGHRAVNETGRKCYHRLAQIVQRLSNFIQSGITHQTQNMILHVKRLLRFLNTLLHTCAQRVYNHC